MYSAQSFTASNLGARSKFQLLTHGRQSECDLTSTKLGQAISELCYRTPANASGSTVTFTSSERPADRRHILIAFKTSAIPAGTFTSVIPRNKLVLSPTPGWHVVNILNGRAVVCWDRFWSLCRS